MYSVPTHNASDSANSTYLRLRTDRQENVDRNASIPRLIFTQDNLNLNLEPSSHLLCIYITQHHLHFRAPLNLGASRRKRKSQIDHVVK